MVIAQGKDMTEYPHFEVFRKNGERWGRLLRDYTYDTGIKGYNRTLDIGYFRCRLTDDGLLTIFKWSEWNFGDGDVTVQDLAMILASLIHDAFCHLTGRGILPYSVRMKADNLFTRMLWKNGSQGLLNAASASWRWFLVTLNSQTKARFNAQPYQFKNED